MNPLVLFGAYFLAFGIFLRTDRYDRFYRWMMGPGGVPERSGRAFAAGPNRSAMSWLAVIGGTGMLLGAVLSMVLS